MWWWVEVPAITRCRVLIAKDTNTSLQEALELLNGHLKYSESLYNNLRGIEIAVLLSLTNIKLKHVSAAENNLKYALELVADDQWIRPFVEAGEPIIDVLIRLKEKQIKPDFVESILKTINEKAETTSFENIKLKTIKKKRREDLITLTTRETEILKYIYEGLENRQIAKKLVRSNETIKKHVSNMLEKLQVKNRLMLVLKAKEQGLL
jgi:LuxR family maltose regulon positive regulatory protein